MIHTVTHADGRKFTSIGSVQVDDLFIPIWPVEEYLNRHVVTPERAEELHKMYPFGAPEGSIQRKNDHIRTSW